MFLSWSVSVFAVALLVTHQCAGEISCKIWSTAGEEVWRGSSFNLYCTFIAKCTKSKSIQKWVEGVCSEPQHQQLNETTIFLRVENITEKRTYSCSSACSSPMVPCGMDIWVGYPPEQPKDISCIYKMLKNDTANVTCFWDSGRKEPDLRKHYVVWASTVIGNHTVCNVSSKRTESPSCSFTLPSFVRFMSVRIRAQNPLGSNESSVSYNLSDIVMPSAPVVNQVKCSSKNCTIKVEQPVWTQYLQIQYRDQQQQEWTTYPDSAGLKNLSKTKLISSLEPCSQYSFRARSRFSTGLWSPWSSTVFNRTEEEAPAQPLDVWLVPSSDFMYMKVYWNEFNRSVCSGSFTGYTISVNSSNSSVVTNVSLDVKNHRLPFCTDCKVAVQTVNSKGSSPLAAITTRHTKAKPLLDVQAAVDNKSVTISWRKDGTALLYYVVEWYSEGHMLDELRWIRVDGKETSITLTDINPWECYEGALYAFYNNSTISKTIFKRIATLEAAPEMGPSAQEKVEGNKVTVEWKGLPRAQRRGCITEFTIYLRNSQGKLTIYTATASQRAYVIKDLLPDEYSLWMSASTSKGEGPPSQKIKFYIVEDDHLFPVLICLSITLMVLFAYCWWKCSAVEHRLKEIFRCLLPDVVPDPANSKWAKECTKEKGKMDLQLPSHNSSSTDLEDETILVDVEELCRHISDSSTLRNNSSRFSTKCSLGQETELSALLYPPLTTYIKSLSHDSDTSGHTQTSLDTNMTVDYISSHGQENLNNSIQEDDEEFPEMQFFPSLSLLMEPVGLGGKLTLDAVKIDCGDLFQNA